MTRQCGIDSTIQLVLRAKSRHTIEEARCILGDSVLGEVRGCRLTTRWSGRVKDKVPSSNVGVRAAQLNR